MRIRYIKPAGDGRVMELADGAARRLIASGAAEEVDADEPTTGEDRPAEEEPTTSRRAAKTSRSR